MIPNCFFTFFLGEIHDPPGYLWEFEAGPGQWQAFLWDVQQILEDSYLDAMQGEGLASERGQTHRFRTRPGTSLPNADEQDKCER